MFFVAASACVTCFWQRMHSCPNSSFKSGQFFPMRDSQGYQPSPFETFCFSTEQTWEMRQKGEGVDLLVPLNRTAALFAEVGKEGDS